jgi:putative DNA primase/helicase
LLAFVRAHRHGEREHLRRELSPHAPVALRPLLRRAERRSRHCTVSALLERRAPMLLQLTQVLELSGRVLAFLHVRGQATRSQISAEFFRRDVPKAWIDVCLDVEFQQVVHGRDAAHGRQAVKR